MCGSVVSVEPMANSQRRNPPTDDLNSLRRGVGWPATHHLSHAQSELGRTSTSTVKLDAHDRHRSDVSSDTALAMRGFHRHVFRDLQFLLSAIGL